MIEFYCHGAGALVSPIFKMKKKIKPTKPLFILKLRFIIIHVPSTYIQEQLFLFLILNSREKISLLLIYIYFYRAIIDTRNKHAAVKISVKIVMYDRA